MHILSICKRIFFTCVIIAGNCLAAQAQKLDSLLTVLQQHAAEDTVKVSLYAQVGSAYRNLSPDSMIAVAHRGRLLAERLHYDKGRASCIMVLGMASLLKNELAASIQMCNEAIAICAKYKDSTGMDMPYYIMGNVYFRQAKYKEAIGCFTICVRLNEGATNYKRLGDSWDNMGSGHCALGNFSLGLEYFLKGLRMREKMNDRRGIASSYGNIARSYASMGNKQKAIEYINRCIEVRREIGDIQGLILTYGSAGGVYASLKEDSSALIAYAQAIAIADSTGQRSELAVLLINAAESHIALGQYDKALACYARCIADKENEGNTGVISMAHRGMGTIMLKKGQTTQAIPHLRQALELFVRAGMKNEIIETASDLGQAYEHTGDLKHALEYNKIYYAYRDSVHSEANAQKAQQVQFDYELEKKQSQIELLNKDKAIEKSRAEKQRAITLSLFVGIVLLLCIALLLYRSRMQERRSKQLVERQALELDELNKFKDKIFSVLSHDLRGPIGSLSTTMSMLDQNIITPEEFSEMKPVIQRQLESLTLLLENLLNWSKNNLTGGIVVKAVALELRELADQSVVLLEPVAAAKHIALVNDIPAGVKAIADASQADTVIRNLLSNALKFTGAQGTVRISAGSEGNNTKIEITDTGVGMRPGQVANLFSVATTNTTYGTSGEKGTGIGLLLCKEFVHANGGSISVSSVEGKGTTFTVTLPARDANAGVSVNG